MPRASNFTDRQKADLFLRDRATCSYTGKSLWLLDYGADPYFDPDWADHLVPVAKGGKSTLANGVAACWSANSEKSDRVDGRVHMFVGGEPTPAYLEACSVLSPQLRQQFERFSRLHYSDWFFNRALFRLLCGIQYLSEKSCTRTRDDLYYSRAAFRARSVWEKILSKESVPSLELRGLTPAAPTVDQRIMLELRDETSVEEICSMMRDLLPTYYARLRTPRASPPSSHEGPLAARLYYAKLRSGRTLI